MLHFETLLAQHPKTALLFSAGKDSLTCLEMLREYLPRITVVWVNPGACHKLTLDYMEKVRSWVPNFVEVKGDQPSVVHQFGWPADVLPVRGSLAGSIGAGSRDVMFQSYTDCCSKSMWEPLSKHLKAEGYTLVVTGQRQEESLRNRLRDNLIQTIDGVTYLQPLHGITSEDVWAFLDKCGSAPPPFYRDGQGSSPDCWNCTAYLDHAKERVTWMREHEPANYEELHNKLLELHLQTISDLKPLAAILES